MQLVFRPVDTPDANPEAAGRAASDVARALEALSANNAAGGAHYIDRAVADLNGAKASSSGAYSDFRATGYAPAYPPR